MADIYIHGISSQDLDLFNQFVARKYLFEQGTVPPKQVLAQRRNELIRAYIKSVADDERTTTAGFHVVPAELGESLKPLIDLLNNKQIPSWPLSSDEKILLVVPRENALEVQASITRLLKQKILSVGEQEY